MKVTIVLLFAAVVSLGALRQSADEVEYEKWMKTVNATMGSLRNNLQGKASEAAAKDAATLVEVFKKSEAFWKGRKKDDAVEWSQKAAAAAGEVETAAKASDFEKAGTSLRAVFGNCAGCHNAYREKTPEGGYRFKQATQ
jgi:cytochrome c556